MDFRSPPSVIDALTQRVQHGVFGYSAPTDSYFDAIGGWMQQRHGWTVERDWVLSLPGVVPTINYLIQTFTEPGDGVLIQPPVYNPFSSAIEKNKRTVVLNPLVLNGTRYEIDFADLAQKAADPKTKLAILCSPHNPVGRVWTTAELRRFAEICIANDLLIVSDEIHHDLILPGHTFTTFAVACPEAIDHTIVCTAPSKTFNLPGLKTSNAFIPNAALRARFQATLERLGLLGINALGIVALETAYRSGGAWLDAALAYIAANYAFLQAYLAENAPALTVLPLEGTYLAWVDCRALGAAATTLSKRLLEEANVYVSDGAGFGKEGQGFIRLNLACPRLILQTALERMQPLFAA
jgi:cystathionine beta-lyase